MQDQPSASTSGAAVKSNENYLDDITVFISSFSKEPSEQSHEMKVINQKWFAFKCGQPPTGFIYFTI